MKSLVLACLVGSSIYKSNGYAAAIYFYWIIWIPFWSKDLIIVTGSIYELMLPAKTLTSQAQVRTVSSSKPFSEVTYLSGMHTGYPLWRYPKNPSKECKHVKHCQWCTYLPFNCPTQGVALPGKLSHQSFSRCLEPDVYIVVEQHPNLQQSNILDGNSNIMANAFPMKTY